MNGELRENFSDNSINVDEKSGGWFFQKNKEYTIFDDGKIQEGNLLLLPKEYQQVEYIESSGTQWIDSKVNSSSDITIDVCLMALVYDSPSLFGSRDDSGNSQTGIFFFDKGNNWGTFVRHGNGSWTYANIKVGNLKINQKYKIFISNEKVLIDDQYITDIPNQVFNDSGYTMSIFGFRNSTTGNIIAYAKCRIYNLKILKENNIYRNFIPCKSVTTVKNSDGNQVLANTNGLYDLVEGKFYTNQGIGDDFTAGPEV